MRIVTVSLLDEHPSVRLTFSTEFYGLEKAEQVRILGLLAGSFEEMGRALDGAPGRADPTRQVAKSLPPEVTTMRGRRRGRR